MLKRASDDNIPKDSSENKYEAKRKRTIVSSWFDEFPGLVHEQCDTSSETARAPAIDKSSPAFN